MKLAFFHDRYLLDGGGAPLYTRRVLEELGRRGHELSLVAVAPEGMAPANPVPAGVQGVALPPWKGPMKRARAVLKIQSLRGGYRLGSWVARSGRANLLSHTPLARALYETSLYQSFDAMVCVGSAVSAWTIPLAAMISRGACPVSVAVPFLHPSEASGQRPILNRVHTGYDVILTATEFESRTLQQRGWANPVIEAAGVGSDAPGEPARPARFRETYGIPDDAPVILFLGRKVYNKGVIHVLQAMETVWQRDPEARLVLMGFRKNPEAWLRGHIDSLRHPPGNRLIDIDDAEEATREDALAACTAMAAPSISDSFGIVYLDAWRHAKPVIGCRDVACESFILPGQNGELVPFNAPAEIARVLTGWLEDPDHARRLGRAGYHTWQTRFTWPLVAEKVERIIGTACTQHAARSRTR